MKKLFVFLAPVFMIFLFSCGETDTVKSNEKVTERRSAGQAAIADDGSQPNIVQIAVGSDDHTTLVAALEAANYVDPLANPGPFTVFAPTNAAFDALPDGLVENLLKPENIEKLKDVLEYHVLIGVYNTPSMINGQRVGTAFGPAVEFEVKEDGTFGVNGHKILGTAVASNGVVHIIDGVLVP